MAATSLKLPDDLKRRIAKLAESSGQTPHAFMVEALEQATTRAELRRRFGDEAAAAEREVEETGKVYDADEAFTYLQARAKGRRARRPRAKAWRRSG